MVVAHSKKPNDAERAAARFFAAADRERWADDPGGQRAIP